MIIKCGINYDSHGRKKKAIKSNVNRHKKFKASASKVVKTTTQADINRETLAEYLKKMPEWESEDTQYKNEVSSNYTVAIAYNKGNYQVIPKGEVKYIGKK